MINEIMKIQKELCLKYKSAWIESPTELKVGISRTVKEGLLPINGLRHPPQGDTTGWYIWAGEELSNVSDFFVPLHVEHLSLWCPQIIKFLGLAPGWRFLTDGDYDDVWYDETLCKL
jgi:hypothetical protein